MQVPRALPQGSAFAFVSRDPAAWTVTVGLFVAVCLVFGQSSRFEFVNFDDGQYVSENRFVISGLSLANIGWAFSHIHAGYWHPLTWLSHMLDCQFFGLDPGAHHMVNVLLHAINAALLFRVLRRFTGELGPSAFAALLFALHPLRVESVAWIAERKDLLCAFWFLLALWAYWHYAKDSKEVSPSPSTASPGSRRRWYGLTLFLFALGLMSKPMVVTLPFVLLLLDYWPLRRCQVAGGGRVARIWGRLVWEKWPFFLLSALTSLLTLITQASAGAVVVGGNTAFPKRLANAVMNYWDYLFKLFWPAHLSVFYPYRETVPGWEVAGAAALFLLATGLVWFGARRRPFLLVGWLWYVGMLVPVSGLVQSGGQATADRFTYLPQVGLALMLAWGLRDLSAGWPQRTFWRGAGVCVLGAVLMFLTSSQTACWHDSESLWQQALACNPSNALAHHNLGSFLEEQGRFDEAIEHYHQAIALQPRQPESYDALGKAFATQGKWSEAIAWHKMALEVQPGFVPAHYNLATVLAWQGRMPEAIDQYREALRLSPGYVAAHYNLGVLLAGQHESAAAIAQYEAVLALDSNHAQAQNNLGHELLARGKVAEAVVHLRRAVALDPGFPEACFNLGVACGLQGRLPEAVAQYRRALELQPGYAEARGNLANVLAAQGNLDDAVAQYRFLLELTPNSVPGHYRLGQALERQGDDAEAVREFVRTLELQPTHPQARMSLAWLLATAPETTLRDGPRALELARAATPVSESNSPEAWDILAAAYAEAGQYNKAIEWGRRAIASDSKPSDPALAEARRQRVKLYEAHEPYHQKQQAPASR